MPSSIRNGNQLTTEEANYNRKVTKMRWVVEAVFGRLQNRFKFFRQRVPNRSIPQLENMLRIACALLNKFSPPINPSKPEDVPQAALILERERMPNCLVERVTEERWSRQRVNWIRGNATDLADFPHLSEDDIKELTIGVYQLKLAPSYTAHHLRGGEFNYSYHRQTPNIVRVRMESRFDLGRFHNIFIEYSTDPQLRGAQSIAGYCCSCECGSRTVGMCAHIATVLWYLGFFRRFPETRLPAVGIEQHAIDTRQRK